jgi:hypothetical protein
VPANQGNACNDFNDCTSQSRCETVDILGQPRGLCMEPTGGSCVGDCGNDGVVAVNELISGVNIALGNSAVSTCPSFDTNGDGMVGINELISGVNALLNGCAG